MGSEAYGLVGFFVMLQAWFGLLDMGLAPAFSRQVSQSYYNAKRSLELIELIRSIELIFVVLAVVLSILFWVFSPWIAEKWLHIETLPLTEVSYCITLIGSLLGFRLFAALYRGAIQGSEQMVWLNVTTVFFSTARSVGSYILIRWVSSSPELFFEFQLAISGLELLVTARKFYSEFSLNSMKKFGFSWAAIKKIAPFSFGIAYSASLWVIVTQTTNLIFSHTLSLTEYGYFTLVGVVANGLLNIIAPISQAILPRMTLLLSEGRDKEMLILYRRSTRLACSLIFPIALFIFAMAYEIVLFWTGDVVVATWCAPIMRWFVLGNAFIAIGAFQYYLQFAHGHLRLHVMNTTISAFVQVPILIFVAFNYGAIGVAYTWFVIRLINFLLITWIVHRKFLSHHHFHFQWLVNDVGLILILSMFTLSSFLMISKLLNLGLMGNLIFMGLALSFLLMLNLILFCSFFKKIYYLYSFARKFV
jgi:O-antigen/teichoic acid export membrane protein